MEYQRFNNLILELAQLVPEDSWINNFVELQLEKDPAFSSSLRLYASALESLDPTSWGYLKSKACEAFRQTLPRRGKQPFFDILNEAIAYEDLHNQGLRPRFLPALHERKQPDIELLTSSGTFYCEVKTINTSDQELARYENEEECSWDTYRRLDKGFMGKLSLDIGKAEAQFPHASPDNIIYIIINFDDWLGINYKRYQLSISEYLRKHHASSRVHCRAEVQGHFRVVPPPVTQ